MMGTEVPIILCPNIPGNHVAIYRLFNREVFSASEQARLAAAYECALEKLHLKDRDDPVTELLAEKIMDVFKAGDHDPQRVCETVLRQLGMSH
jgi:hypothetical protein